MLVKNKEIKDDVIYMVRITNISGKCDSDDMMMILMRIENYELTKDLKVIMITLMITLIVKNYDIDDDAMMMILENWELTLGLVRVRPHYLMSRRLAMASNE